MSTKKSSRKKSFTLISLGVTVLVVIVLLSVLRFDQLSFFPGEKEVYEIGTYHEQMDTGYSVANVAHLENGDLSFKYKLTEEKAEPFVGLFFKKKEHQDLFYDLTKYNEIVISLSAKEGKRIPINFTVDYEGFTKSVDNDDLTSLPFSCVIEYEGPGEYHLPIEDFKIPSWWFREKNVNDSKVKEDFQNYSFKRVNFFVVGSCQTLGPNKEDEIIISSINFNNNHQKSILFAVIFWVVLMTLNLVWYLMGKKEKVLVPVQMSETDDTEAESKIERLINYIAKNYADPDLKSSKINAELGISTRDIGLLIKEHYSTSFKNYLNTVRLTEVKRLLKETQLSVSEIAYSCGYNNISHFNRLFKAEIGISPKAFREALPE